MVETTLKIVFYGVSYTMKMGPSWLFVLLKTYRGGHISIVYNTVNHIEFL